MFSRWKLHDVEGGKKVNSDSLRAGVQSKVFSSFLLTVQDFNRLSTTNMYFFASGVKKKILHKCLFLHHFWEIAAVSPLAFLLSFNTELGGKEEVVQDLQRPSHVWETTQIYEDVHSIGACGPENLEAKWPLVDPHNGTQCSCKKRMKKYNVAARTGTLCLKPSLRDNGGERAWSTRSITGSDLYKKAKGRCIHLPAL